MFTAEADGGDPTFEVSYVDFPTDSIVGDQSRVDFGARALEFKPGFKDRKDLKLDNHPGAEVVIDDSSGPISGVHNGKFTGNDVLDTGFKCEPGRWYKVTLRIDVAKQTWDFFVDDKRFESAKPLAFRGVVPYLDAINFLVEGGVYIDDLRVTRQ